MSPFVFFSHYDTTLWRKMTKIMLRKTMKASHFSIFEFFFFFFILLLTADLSALAQRGNHIQCHLWMSTSNLSVLAILPRDRWKENPTEMEHCASQSSFESLFKSNIVLVCPGSSQYYQRGFCAWADCEILLPFKRASPLHYQVNILLL